MQQQSAGGDMNQREPSEVQAPAKSTRAQQPSAKKKKNTKSINTADDITTTAVEKASASISNDESIATTADRVEEVAIQPATSELI